MEKFIVEQDINVCCVTAASFPNGVMAAFNKLHELFPFSSGRRNFGLSRPNEKGEIIYKAAAEELSEGEAEQTGCERITIRKGEYISIMVHDYMQHIPAIGQAFAELIKVPGIDPEGYCVEWYLNDKDVRCTVRLADKK
jgi:hypothetical protein